MAVISTAIGVAFDAGSGDKELTVVFAALYAVGCVAAVLMVQQSAVFATVVQPPLILFVSVPAAYWVFHGAGFPGLKNIAINCGYPLIERFPLMLFTAAAVLLIGMVRWYLGMLDGGVQKRVTEKPGTANPPAFVGKLVALVNSALNRNPAHAVERPASRPPRSGERPRRATAEARRAAREAGSRTRNRPTGHRGATNGAAPTRSRHVRPQMDDQEAPRPRRRPPAGTRQDPPQRRRRPAPEVRDEHQPRRRPAPEWQDQPRRRPRPSPDAPRAAEPMPRPHRDPRTRGYRPDEVAEGLPRRHPVSQVRYRRAAGAESDAAPRPRAHSSREEFDSWEFDI